MIAAQEICAVRRNKSMKNQAAIDAQQPNAAGWKAKSRKAGASLIAGLS
jgi:hypothetical protein